MPSAIRIPQLELTGIEEQLDVNPLEVEVVNTAVLTTVYSFVVPAGAMGTDRLLEVGMIGDYQNGALGGQGVTLRVSLGAVTLYEDTSPNLAIGQGNTRRAALMRMQLSNRDVTNAQIGGGYFIIGEDGVAARGFGTLADLATADRTGSEYVTIQSAVDTTVAQTVTVRFAHNNASVNISFRKQLGWAKIVRVS